MNKVFFAGLVLVAAQTAVAAPELQDRYNQTCNICHLAGVGGAPKTGDVAAWAPRLAKGMDTLVSNVKSGMNAMPPKGMCFDCSDDEFEALIDFMVAPR